MLEEGEFWARDLEGCAVVDGDVGGRLRAPHERAAVVRGARGRPPDGSELLVPMVRDAIRSIDLEARRIDVDLGFLGEELTSSRCSRSGSTGSATQRHVENALALGHAVEAVDFRASTPLKWGQVDDTPFGGGAGMVLRVDVMEAALRARYGVDPVALRSRRRVIALTPGRAAARRRAGRPSWRPRRS